MQKWTYHGHPTMNEHVSPYLGPSLKSFTCAQYIQVFGRILHYLSGWLTTIRRHLHSHLRGCCWGRLSGICRLLRAFLFYCAASPCVVSTCAVVASSTAVSDRASARRLGQASIGLSVSGIILSVVAVIIVVAVIVPALSSAASSYCKYYRNGNCYRYRQVYNRFSSYCTGYPSGSYCYYN